MFKMFLNGQWEEGKGEKRELINPATGERIGVIHDASREQVNRAINFAHSTFHSTDWGQNLQLRIKVLREAANGLESYAEEMAKLETENTGKPIRESRLDVQDSIACLRYYAGLMEQESPWQKKMDDGSISQIKQEPVGVCGLIVPWNFPLLLGMWKIAPALAAGNTIVFKPSETTPLSLIKFTEILEAAGLPQGVFNLVLGAGEIGQEIVQHEKVDKISFTGGVETGKRIYAQSAQTLKRISLELGGKSPLLIFDDVPVDEAVEWAIFGSFFNQGQVCVASSRILVHQSLYETFIERLLNRLEHLIIGSPLNESTEMGPLIHRQHLEKVEHYIQLGQAEGARLLTGGKRIEDLPGYYLTPAVFVDVHQKMKIVQEEIFGPVNTIQPFLHEQEAVQLANGTAYGLAAGVLSNNVERAKRVAEQLKAGTIWINGYHTPYVEAPWGGYKQSGLGRELGAQGLTSFVEYKHTNSRSKLSSLDWYNRE